MSWKDIPGWSTEIVPFYERMAKQLPVGGTFVEVGTFLGRSLACMGELRTDLKLWSVDQWKDGPSQGYDGHGIFENEVKPYGCLFMAFLGHMTKHSPDVLARTHIIRAASHEVLLPSGSADLVFIDGAHDYESVARDLQLYGGVVKKGGILAGHDYTTDGFPGLVKAVDEYFVGKPNIENEGPCHVWWVRT